MPTTTLDTRFQSDGNGAPTGMVGTSRGDPSDKMPLAVRQLLGDNIRLTDRMAMGNIDYHTGPSHSTTGIPYAIHGTATVINKEVTAALATFDDPIKAILPVAIHTDQKIIIRRKYVVGGSAIITPEHTAARTVDIKEDEREIVMTRYGGDAVMNLNLFLRPNDAADEIRMKVTAQRRELEHTLVALGYEAVMREGTNIMAAMVRANPAYAHLDALERQQIVEKTYIHSVFGCINKFPYPIQNLLAAAMRANLYVPGNNNDTNKPAVLIVPAGIMDLTKFTRESDMKFSVSGVTSTSNLIPKKLSEVSLSNVLQDKGSNVRIMVHLPPANNDAGAAFPQVSHNSLMTPTSWATYYPLSTAVCDPAVPNQVRVTDFKRRRWAVPNVTNILSEMASEYTLPVTQAMINAAQRIAPAPATGSTRDVVKTAAVNAALAVGATHAERKAAVYATYAAAADGDELPIFDAGGNVLLHWAYNEHNELVELDFMLVRPKMTAMMQSAILATDVGNDAGELLMAYASTGITTDQTAETWRLQLRVYMEAAIYQPEKFVILPDVAFSGAIHGHGSVVCTGPDFNPDTHDLILAVKAKNFDDCCLLKDYFFRNTAGIRYYPTYAARFIAGNGAEEASDDLGGDAPLSFYQGRTDECFNGKWEKATDNFGHLSTLDSPVMSDRVDGMQKYQTVPVE